MRRANRNSHPRVSGCDAPFRRPRRSIRAEPDASLRSENHGVEALARGRRTPGWRTSAGRSHPLARQMQCVPSSGISGPRHDHVLQPLKAGVFDLFRACGRLAPDPHSHGRTHLPGRRPRLCFFRLRCDFCWSIEAAGVAPRTSRTCRVSAWPVGCRCRSGWLVGLDFPLRLDCGRGPALRSRVGRNAVGSGFRASERPPPTRQRSFNWQSTAFVMRGLRVRLPPLALHPEFCFRPDSGWSH